MLQKYCKNVARLETLGYPKRVCVAEESIVFGILNLKQGILQIHCLKSGSLEQGAFFELKAF